MTDLEMTRACAESMGYIFQKENEYAPGILVTGIVDDISRYDPLHDGAQAMALLYWLMDEGEIILTADEFHFNSDEHKMDEIYVVRSQEMLRRAIVECVAKLKGRP